jgi:hypothetical protein
MSVLRCYTDLIGLLVLLAVAGHANAASADAEAKTTFCFRYAQAYSLRTLNATAERSLRPSDERYRGTVNSNAELRVPFDITKIDEYLDNAWEKYDTAEKEKKLAEITIDGNSKDAIDLAANEIWERTAGSIVDRICEQFGAQFGSMGGKYVGGELGLALGILFPEIELPLVLGGVFLGDNFGKALGYVAGKIGSMLANEFVEDTFIDPAAEHLLRGFLNNTFNAAGTNSSVTCKVGICQSGHAQEACECHPCLGPKMYQADDGQTTCQTCPPGSNSCNGYGSCGGTGIGYSCRNCPVGGYEKEGECVPCQGNRVYQS